MSDLAPTPTEHYGFLIFRNGCKADEKWERFMAFLKYQVRHSLASEGFPQFYESMDWKVIDAPNEGERGIRERFNRWLDSGEESQNPENYRYHACVMVVEAMQDIVDDFMKGKSLDDDDAVDENDETFVTVVSRYEEEGEVDVSIPYLMRAGNTIAMRGEGVGWELVWVPDSDIATGLTEMEKVLGPIYSRRS